LEHGLATSGARYGQRQNQVVRQQKGVRLHRQNSGRDVFVHHTSITGQGFKTLNEGDEVSFEVVPSEKGLKAANVQRVSAA
jgi:cold shock protein